MQFGNITRGPGDEEESAEFEIDQEEYIQDYFDDDYDYNYSSDYDYSYDYDHGGYDYSYE